MLSTASNLQRRLVSEEDEHAPVRHFYRVGPQVDADRSAQGLARSNVEPAKVHRALDFPVHQLSVGQMNLLVRTQAIGCVELLVCGSVDRKGPVTQVKPSHGIGRNLVHSADEPGLAHH